MNLLFVHQGFPGQYQHICRALANQGDHQLVSLGMQHSRNHLAKGLQHLIYGLTRGNGQDVHPFAKETESKVIRAEACAHAAEKLKSQGFVPDIICGHPGWGELLFLPYVWPKTPILMYQEFFYQIRGLDYDYDPEFLGDLEWHQCAMPHMKNANALLNLESSTWNITPTNFQKCSFPGKFHQYFSVIHDGIDTSSAAPARDNIGLSLTLRDNTILHQGQKIITFVNRRIEPYRGCHSFIRSIPRILELQPDAEIVIVGEEKGVSYGARCPKGEWKDYFMKEIEGSYDPSKVHYTGVLKYDDFLKLLQLSQAHVYLTYPFVLSWSLLEAMSTGCAIVGSRTEPVEEVINHGANGLLVDFFKPGEIAESVNTLLSDHNLAIELGNQARADILSNYSLDQCLPRQLELINLVASGALKQS